MASRRARSAAVADPVSAYIDAAAEPARSRLRLLRSVVRDEAPDAIERMAYGLPTWHQGENLVHLGAFARHVGLYPGPAAIAAFADRLEAFRTSKGAIQFPHDRELPVELVRRIVRWRLEHLQGRSSTPRAPDKGSSRGQRVARVDGPATRLTRPLQPMPPGVRTALREHGLMDAYRERPPYQQNDYLGWINRAKRAETRAARLQQMLDELARGDRYMKMAWHPPRRGR